MLRQKFRKVIRDDAVLIDGGVEAAFAAAGLEYIPQRDMRVLQCCGALWIRRLRIEIQQFTHNPPERIARMRIVLLHLQRHNAGHRAENQRM